MKASIFPMLEVEAYSVDFFLFYFSTTFLRFQFTILQLVWNAKALFWTVVFVIHFQRMVVNSILFVRDMWRTRNKISQMTIKSHSTVYQSTIGKFCTNKGHTHTARFIYSMIFPICWLAQNKIRDGSWYLTETPKVVNDFAHFPNVCGFNVGPHRMRRQWMRRIDFSQSQSTRSHSGVHISNTILFLSKILNCSN